MEKEPGVNVSVDEAAVDNEREDLISIYSGAIKGGVPKIGLFSSGRSPRQKLPLALR